tara:strand:+ start:364 stop:942 length:579 start_codon:yes stop_codon:yes gene_type:complete
MNEDLPSPEMLRKLLSYDPNTGLFFWRERNIEDFPSEKDGEAKRWNGRYANKQAFASKNSAGYYTGTVLKIPLSAHRVAWAMTYGEWPSGEIDHINRVRHDNRIVNLKDGTRSDNNKNKSMQSNNTSECTGVHWHKPNGKWAARISVKSKRVHLGYFTSKNEAVSARNAAVIKYGYSHSHGKDAYKEKPASA